MSKLGEIIDGLLAIDPDADAIEFKMHWWRWGDLARVGAALEAELDRAGLGAQARVGGVMRNHPAMAAVILKVVSSDRCLVTLNPSLPDERLAADIEALRPPVVVAFGRDWARAEVVAAAKAIGCLGLELTDDPDQPLKPVAGLETASGSALKRTTDEPIGIEMLTSGTTGTPKRVPLKQKTLTQSVLDAGVYDGRSADSAPKLRSGVSVMTAPYAHISGIFGLLNTVAAGRKQALLERFSVEDWADAVSRHKPKVANAPPAALRMILDAKVPKAALESLVAYRTGTAPLDPDLADEFYERYCIPVLQNYSATEFAGAGAGWTLEDHRQYHKSKRGSVGRINPGIQARIVDQETGEPLPPGGQGLLEILAGHLGDGKNWVRTTDLAVIDADNFMWIKGRADNAIIRGGFKVFPDDVVRAIEQHPAVLEAACTGLSDSRLGQVPVAAFITKSGAATPSEDELKVFLEDKLIRYQIPVQILAVKELPRTPSLKVSQPDLRRLFTADAA